MGLSGFAGVDLSQEIGAFAVSVGCGYFNDPRGLPGLAHALEHAIFLGSSMQPDLKGWDEFISSRGGTHNAHTKPDTTTFYVSAPSKHLAELFGVFLDHIFHPLLLTQQMQSEVGTFPTTAAGCSNKETINNGESELETDKFTHTDN